MPKRYNFVAMKFKLILKNLPFEPQRDQIIFVENTYNEDVNQFIKDNYEHICNYCSVKGFKFCYLPKLNAEGLDTDVLFYNVPYATYYKSEETFTSEYLLRFMANPKNKDLIPPSLLYYKTLGFVHRGETIFDGLSVTDQEETPTLEEIFFMRLDEIFDSFVIHGQPKFSFGPDEDKPRIRFQKVPKSEEEEELKDKKENRRLREIFDDMKMMVEDDGISEAGEDDDAFSDYSCSCEIDIGDRFDEISRMIANEVKERIELLKCRGIDMLTLIQYIKDQEPLSHLHITKDFRIFLPDYGNIEIEMTPLPKAIFFLYLRHPEGIPYKYLPDYQEELMELYKLLKPNTDRVKMRESIEFVTNPLSNSINEKCARIREAFITKFDEHLAKNYYITGKRGFAKKINLPRDLVVWEE